MKIFKMGFPIFAELGRTAWRRGEKRKDERERLVR
jgi:hypothetical protein